MRALTWVSQGGFFSTDNGGGQDGTNFPLTGVDILSSLDVGEVRLSSGAPWFGHPAILDVGLGVE